MLEQLFKWIPDSRSWLVHNKSSVDVTLITTGHIGNCEQNCHKHYPFKKKKRDAPKGGQIKFELEYEYYERFLSVVILLKRLFFVAPTGGPVPKIIRVPEPFFGLFLCKK